MAYTFKKGDRVLVNEPGHCYQGKVVTIEQDSSCPWVTNPNGYDECSSCGICHFVNQAYCDLVLKPINNEPEAQKESIQMNNNQLANELKVSKMTEDDQVLYRAGVIDINGGITDSGVALTSRVLFDENKALVVKAAQDILAVRNANK